MGLGKIKGTEYIVTDKYETMKGEKLFGVARGYKKWADGSFEWATWLFDPDNNNYYYLGQYMMTEEESFENFKERIGF